MASEEGGLKNCNDAEFINALAELCEIAAHIVFTSGDLIDRDAVASSTSPALAEKLYFEQNYEASEDERDHPPFWIALIVSTYLPECGHICLGLAAQLRARAFVVGVHSAVRAVIERVGRLKWILATDCNAHQRYARAGLEMTVCQQYYRRAIDGLKAASSDRKHARAEHVRLRECLDRYFEVVYKPPSDPCDDSSSPSSEAIDWVVDGEGYPDYTKLTSYVLDAMGGKSAGTYGAYSGLTHPNVQASAEHRRFAEDGSISFVTTCGDLEKSVRVACFATFDALRNVVAYNGGDTEVLQQRIDACAERMDSISVLDAGT